MERPAGAPVPVPRVLRQPQETNNGNSNSPNSRDSLKAITRSIVQRRTQMFEHGNVVNLDENQPDVTNTESTTSAVTMAVSATDEMDQKPSEILRNEIARRTPEERSPSSPKKLPRVSPASPSPTPGQNSERMSPQSSPTHVAKARRTPSPRQGSPVRSHKHLAKCQPKIILGAAPQPVETPVKPPRSKKPSVKLKSQDEFQSPSLPNMVLSPSRSESVSITNRPTPVRRAPDIPTAKPHKPSVHHPQEKADKDDTGPPRLTKPSLPDKSNVLSQRSPSKMEDNVKPQKPPKPEKPEDIYGQKGSKPALPEKPDDVSLVQKASKPPPPEKPEGLGEKSLLQQQQQQPEWLKKRNELMKTRSVSEPIGETAETDEDAIAPKSVVNDANFPKYASVDKSKKRNRPKSGEGQDKKERTSYYDNVTSSQIAGDIHSGDSDAPPKPPRTFAHDIYLKKKAERREKRRSQSATAKIPLYDEVAVNGDGQKTDTVEPYAVDDGSNKITPYAQSTDVREDGGASPARLDGLYEEIGERNKNRKPAPPPRPKAPQRPPAPIMRGRKDQSPVVKLFKHNSEIPEEGFIKSGQRKISNPSYERHHSIIPIKTYRDQETGALKRHKSDEYLYADPQVMLDKSPHGVVPLEDPIYQDPVDLASPRVKSCITPHGVSLDEEGYAIPDTMRHTMGRRQKFRSPSFNIKGVQKWGTLDRSKLARLANHDFRATLVRKKLPSVREKVSRAYSILHKRPPISPEGQPLPPVSSPEDDDEDSQVDLEEHKRRMAHVNSRKEKHYATLESAREGLGRRSDRLFDYSLVVGLEKDPDTNKYRPCIIYKYPDQLGPEAETIAEFCFPDAEQWRPVTQAHTEDFSFVLTSEDGAHHYGYCRRLLPPGSQNRLPEVYCVVSSLNAVGFYQQLLAEFNRLRKLSPDLPFHLIKAAYAQPIPAPGREAWIACPVTDGKKETIILKRSTDSRLDKDDGKLLFEGNVVSFTALFKHLTVDTILKIFGAVLLERRILFTAQHLSTLSSCVTALSILLYPFVWQHTFVPVLPVSMLDVCCAPTPYILGILSTALPKIQELELEEVLIVDLDTNSLIASIGDENAILPRKLQKCLRNALAEESEVTGVTRDTIVFEAFLRMFVETTGHYTEFMNTQQDGELVFQKEQFIKAVSSKSIRMFLEWFVETQMFEVFITEKLQDGGNTAGLFETRIEEYREEMEQMTLSFKDNVKQIGRRMMTLVSEAGGKLKKALGGERNVYV